MTVNPYQTKMIIDGIRNKIEACQGTRIWDDYINSLKLISQVVFTRSSGFVPELIQNAEDAQSIVVTSKDKQKITLTAPKALLAYLQIILPNYIGEEWRQIINQILIPSDTGLLDKRRDEILSEVTALRHKIKTLQEEIDSIVFNLYDLSQQEQEIVTNAVS